MESKENNHFELNGGTFLGTFKSDDETDGGFLGTGILLHLVMKMKVSRHIL